MQNRTFRDHEEGSCSLTEQKNELFFPDLPVYEPMASPTFTWGDYDSDTTISCITSAYTEVMHWKKRLFPVSWGNVGSSFISELARLYRAYAERFALECITQKAVAILPSLLLQKPHAKTKHNEHKDCLELRLKLWKKGDFDTLITEGRILQKSLKRKPLHSTIFDSDNPEMLFANRMFDGNVKEALRLLQKNAEGGILNPDDKITCGNSTVSVLEALKIKHPDGKPASMDAILPVKNNQVTAHPVIFDKIDASLIRTTVLHTAGSAGPSGLDAKCWRKMCTSYKTELDDLCHALALMAKRLASSYVHMEGLEPFLACRLVALDKDQEYDLSVIFVNFLAANLLKLSLL